MRQHSIGPMYGEMWQRDQWKHRRALTIN